MFRKCFALMMLGGALLMGNVMAQDAVQNKACAGKSCAVKAAGDCTAQGCDRQAVAGKKCTDCKLKAAKQCPKAAAKQCKLQAGKQCPKAAVKTCDGCKKKMGKNACSGKVCDKKGKDAHTCTSCKK